MASIEKIYKIWGDNAEALASDIGEAGITVRQWRNRKSIPPRVWAPIIAKAAEKGFPLTVADFGPPPAEVEAFEMARRAERDAA
jgi:hypothetical protein